MPENNLQANLILSGQPGRTDRVSRPSQHANSSEPGPWADMLARIGDKNARLFRRVTERQAAPGRSIFTELQKERSRIGRELHAGAGQPIAGILQNLEMLGEYADEMSPPVKEIVRRLECLARQARDQVRAVSHSLYPPDWQRLNLADAIRLLVETGVPAGRYQTTLHISPPAYEPSHFVRIALYRCAQECISNMLRHAQATTFGLWLRFDEANAELEVRDNGRGFAGSAGNGDGIGISALHESARMLGGVCRISSGPDGTRVIFRVPLVVD